jgi:hypothetical protein
MKIMQGYNTQNTLDHQEEDNKDLSVPSLEDLDSNDDLDEEVENDDIDGEEDDIHEEEDDDISENSEITENKEESILSSVPTSQGKFEMDAIKSIMFRVEMMNAEIFRKLDTICHRIETIEDRLIHIEESQKYNYTEYNGEIIRIKEMKSETYKIPDYEVHKALVYQDFRSIMYIFKLHYRTIHGGKIFYPVRSKSTRSFEYYLNGKWILDPNGHYTIKTLCNNVQNLFLKFNVIDNKLIKEDDFYANQTFIMKLSEEKYNKKIFKDIYEEINKTIS